MRLISSLRLFELQIDDVSSQSSFIGAFILSRHPLKGMPQGTILGPLLIVNKKFMRLVW